MTFQRLVLRTPHYTKGDLFGVVSSPLRDTVHWSGMQDILVVAPLMFPELVDSSTALVWVVVEQLAFHNMGFDPDEKPLGLVVGFELSLLAGERSIVGTLVLQLI